MEKNPFENRPITQQAVHIIYRLKGSLPRQLIHDLASSMEAEIVQLKMDFGPIKKGDLAAEIRLEGAIAIIKAKYQLRFDGLLDRINDGPMFLQDPKAKQCIIDSWLHIEKAESLAVYAISVMSNHVHILLAHTDPNGSLDFGELLARHKRYTARFINELQGQKGRKVWANKAFDRDLRPDTFATILWYILNNPVKAGLTDDPLGWYGNYFAPSLFEG